MEEHCQPIHPNDQATGVAIRIVTEVHFPDFGICDVFMLGWKWEGILSFKMTLIPPILELSSSL